MGVDFEVEIEVEIEVEVIGKANGSSGTRRGRIKPERRSGEE